MVEFPSSEDMSMGTRRAWWVGLGAAVLLLSQGNPRYATADTCNGKVASKIGCPIPQPSCKDAGCGGAVLSCDACSSPIEV